MEKKIRILHILALGGIGGAEKYLLSLCRMLNKERFKIKVCVLLSGGIVSDQIASEGTEVLIMKMENGFDILKALRLISFVRSRKIDIIHHHHENPLGKVISILNVVPVVIHTDHGTTLGSPVKRKKRVILANRLMTFFIDHFIAISNGMKKTLNIREKVPNKKITLIYNGVDVEGISKIACDKKKKRKSLQIPKGIHIFGAVGRLVPEKQYPLLLQSLAILKKQDVEFVTLIVGDGIERKILETKLEELNLKGNVRFLGQRNDVIYLLDLIDVFVFTSGGEGFSITVLEAMAKAKPVVAFDVEGINEAVVNNETGFLVPFGSVELFAQKINYLVKSKNVADRMGENGYKRAKQMFNLETNIKKTETLYENLMKNYIIQNH